MNLAHKCFLYRDSEQYLEIKKELGDWVFLNVVLFFHQRKFLEFQKNLVQDFVANLVEELMIDSSDFVKVRNVFELKLQELNTQLTTFAEKLEAVEVFNIDGCMQLVSLWTLLTSLIGNVSLMIFRDKRLYYELYNSVYDDTKIDLFSDFIEGELEHHDELVYLGNDFKHLVDVDALYEMQENIGDTVSIKVYSLMNQMFETQWVQADANFLAGYTITPRAIGQSSRKSLSERFGWNMWKYGSKVSNFTDKLTQSLSLNKYYITVVVLVVLVLFMLYSVLNQLLEKQNVDKFLTSSGVEVTLTIDKLKNEIYEFKTMNPKSNQKSQKYSEILQQIELLRKKGKWLDDIANLEKILQKDYYDGFNIHLVSDMKVFNDVWLGTSAKILTLNTTELEKLWALKTLSYHKGLFLGWEKWALVNALNDGSRWVLIEYLIENPMKACTMNLLRNGLYCYTHASELFNITKEGIVPVTIVDNELPDTIGGVEVYGKLNMYIFQPNLNSSLPGVFTTKYTNERGSQVSFTRPRNYTLLDVATWAIQELDWAFASTAIDGNFLVWSNQKLYQLWRPTSASALDVRQVPLIGGDKLSSLSDDVKVISHYGSKYVYLFDKEKNSFSVYVSDPKKTLEASEKSYSLTYLFSFKFELANDEKVVDIATNAGTVQKPEAYVMTDKAVYKINLYSFIDSYTDK